MDMLQGETPKQKYEYLKRILSYLDIHKNKIANDLIDDITQMSEEDFEKINSAIKSEPCSHEWQMVGYGGLYKCIECHITVDENEFKKQLKK